MSKISLANTTSCYYEDLAFEIIKQALADLQRSKKIITNMDSKIRSLEEQLIAAIEVEKEESLHTSLKRARLIRRNAVELKNEVARFFRGSWFESLAILAGINHETIRNRLKKED